MPIQATCPYCATLCSIGEQHVGQMVRCFACAQVFRVHGSNAAPAAPVSLEFDAIPMPSFDAEPERPAPLTLDIHAATSAGKVREHNEDAYLIRRQAWSRLDDRCELVLLAVADGMGGYGGGALASALTVRALQSALTPWFDGALAGQLRPEQTAIDQLRGALTQASQAVHAAAQADAQRKGMGAAAVAAVLWRNTAFVGHVGDCRAYQFHEGQLTQVTKDQTLVQRMLDQGTLQPHEAAHHPARNELSQAIGRRPEVTPEFCQLSLGRGDWLILACDGLQAHLSHAELRKEIELALPSASFLAERLVDAANQRGGSDNCTVIVVHGA
ncbi:MAG: protein phosphatase 2C domain-containing protein [Gemmataceae bacterium]|nr:protein phosphatase 2C domain-containing protein [Gemmataceae bacterium]